MKMRLTVVVAGGAHCGFYIAEFKGRRLGCRRRWRRGGGCGGRGVAQGGFDAVEVAGVGAQGGGVATEFLAELGQAQDDEGFGAGAAAGDFFGGHGFQAVEAEDLEDGGFAPIRLGVELFDEGEELAGLVVGFLTGCAFHGGCGDGRRGGQLGKVAVDG